MFCPNCDKDCADSNFCPKCGHSLQDNSTAQSTEEQRKQLQASGEVYCPVCLSTNVLVRKSDYNSYLLLQTGAKLAVMLGTLLCREREHGTKFNCNKCGYEWYTDRVRLVEQHQEHIRTILEGNPTIIYPGLNGGYWKFDVSGIVLFHPKKRFSAIPYDQIAGIELQIRDNCRQGWLTIRHIGNIKKPFPQDLNDAKKDKATLLCDCRHIEKYHRLFCQLNAILQKNKSAGVL